MSLQLVVVFAAVVLAFAQGVPLSPKLQSHLGQRLFQSCNPHLRMPNGSRMEVDLASYYGEVGPKCLGGGVMVTFNIQRKFKLFETKEDTAICHGFIELLSLIDAYNWTKEMCEEKAIADERGAFCKTYSARQKDIGNLTLRYNATGYNHLTVVSLLLSRMGQENCKEFCNGIMNSTLCNSFVDASGFFLRKYESDQPQEKIIIPEENTTKSVPLRTDSRLPHPSAENVPPRVPAVPAQPTADDASDDDKAARVLYLLIQKLMKNMPTEKAGLTSETQDKPTVIIPTSPSISPPPDVVGAAVVVSPSSADGTPVSTPPETTATAPSEAPTTEVRSPEPSEAPTTKDTAAPSKEPSEKGLEGAPPPSSSDEPTEAEKSETFPIEPLHPPEDANMGTVLETVLEEFDMTKEDLLAMLGPDFHRDLNTMTYEEVVDALDDAEIALEADLDDEEDTLTTEELEQFKAWQKGGEDTDLSPIAGVPDKKPQEPVAESPEQKVDEIIKLGTTKVDELEKEVEEEVKSGSYGSWHFFTIILVLATVVIGGYLCVHNRKKLREGVGSYLSDSKHRRKRTREYKPLMDQT